MKSSVYYNYFFLLFISIIWGAQFAINDIALQSLPPLYIATGRLLIGFFTLSIYVFLFVRRPHNDTQTLNHSSRMDIVLYICIAVFEGIAPVFLIAWGLQYVGSSIAAILMGTIPMVTVCITTILAKGNKLSWQVIRGILIGFVGLLVLVMPNMAGNSASFMGMLSIFLGSVSFATSLILTKYLSAAQHPIKHVRNILGVASLCLVIITASQYKGVDSTLNSLLALLFLGVFCTGVVYALFIILIQRTTPVFASAVNYLIPIIGVLIGNVFMQEKLSGYTVAALLCILAALYQLRGIGADEHG